MYFQGYHYQCIICETLYFPKEWQVCRHLREHHTGIQHQCQLCYQIHLRNTITHGCNARASDFEPMHVESGEKGDAARKRLDYFIANVMDKKWRFVPGDDVETDSPDYLVKSQVTRIEKTCHTGTRFEKGCPTGTRVEKSSKPVNTETAGRQPRLNHKTFKREAGKTRILKSDPAKKPRLTSESKRAHSPVDLGMDPLVEVSEGPIFSLPIKILEDDPEFVPSLEALT